MNYFNSELVGIDIKEIPARLSFDIATARNSEISLVKFTFEKKDEKFDKAVSARLKELKKRGIITFFVSSLDFFSEKTEVEYLFNKFP